MTPTEGGFLRLDKETGAVSFCTVDAGLSVCRVSADERAALENEIARLRRDNAELEAARGPNAPGASSGLPKDEDMDRVLSFTERFMRAPSCASSRKKRTARRMAKAFFWNPRQS